MYIHELNFNRYFDDCIFMSSIIVITDWPRVCQTRDEGSSINYCWRHNEQVAENVWGIGVVMDRLLFGYEEMESIYPLLCVRNLRNESNDRHVAVAVIRGIRVMVDRLLCIHLHIQTFLRSIHLSIRSFAHAPIQPCMHACIYHLSSHASTHPFVHL